MIDLRERGLPETITVDGKPFHIKTDFRVWLDFLNRASETNAGCDFVFWDLFDGEYPMDRFFNELLEFFVNPSPTPKSGKSRSNAKQIDFVLDGNYIYAAFMQQYGIDLVEIEYLHWHKFKALFDGLSEDCFIVKIMGYRGYVKAKKDDTHEKDMERLKRMWTFPTAVDPAVQAKIDEFNSL